MSGTGNGSKNEYMFKKLQGSYNYKKRTRNMGFVPEEAGLWRHVEGTAVALSYLEAKKNDNEDRMEKIFARKVKICEFQDNSWKAIAKIGKMCTDTVQKKLFFVRALREWLLRSSGVIWKPDPRFRTGTLNGIQLANYTKFDMKTAKYSGIYDQNPWCEIWNWRHKNHHRCGHHDPGSKLSQLFFCIVSWYLEPQSQRKEKISYTWECCPISKR